MIVLIVRLLFNDLLVIREIGLVIVELLQHLHLLQSLETLQNKILLIDLEPDNDEEHSSEDRNDAEAGSDVLMKVDHQMEEDSGAAKDEQQDKDKVEEEPRDDELGVAALGADHKENVDNEAEETGKEDPCEESIQLMGSDKPVDTLNIRCRY